ncbi:uncharacterized protein METZ01_LOCUS267142, partial [marine metagenome]
YCWHRSVRRLYAYFHRQRINDSYPKTSDRLSTKV